MRLSIFSAAKPVEEPLQDRPANLNPLWANLFSPAFTREREDEEIVGVLRKIPLFGELTKRELLAVTRILYKRTYEPNEIIFHQADPGLGMYIIVRGRVAIVSEPANHLLAELQDGDFFGELALLDELPRSATAITKTSANILGFFQPDFLGLLERHPRLGVKVTLRLAKMIGGRLRATDEQTTNVRV
jgi:CRP/FNR family transcriptional regulator, cyclic AMP receptor protein